MPAIILMHLNAIHGTYSVSGATSGGGERHVGMAAACCASCRAATPPTASVNRAIVDSLSR